MKHSLHIFALSMTLCSISWAEVQLETQMINGHRVGYGHLSEQPVRVEIIGQQAIEENHASNLADALQYTTGIQLKPITGKSGLGVWLQGYDSDRVAILIDGNPLTAGTGSSVDVSQIALGDIERIEISKGSMSAIYGSNAMGGVVNIISKVPDKGHVASFSYSGGSWGSQDLPYAEVAVGKQHIRTSLSSRTNENYIQILSDSQISSGYRVPNADGSQGWDGYKTNLSAKSHIKFNDSTSLTVSPRLYKEDIKTFKDNFIGGIGSIPKDKIDLTNKLFVSTVLNHTTGQGDKLKLNINTENYKNESRQDIRQTQHIEQKRITDIKHQSIILHYKSLSNDGSQIIVSAELLNDSMNAEQEKDDNSGNITRSIEVDNKHIQNQNIAAQASWQVTPEFEWLISTRANHNQKYGFELSPMLNAQYRPFDLLDGELSFRFGAGHGYRTPTLKELYHFFDHSQLGYVLLGNDNLLPESSLNLQASMDWQPNEKSSFDMSVFYNDIKNLIDFYEDSEETRDLSLQYGETVTANYYGNIDHSITAGTEFSFTQQINNWLSSSLSYAYLYSLNKANNKALTKRPEHDIKASLDFFLTYKTKLAIKYKYSSEQYSDIENNNLTPAYSQVDLKFNYAWSDTLNFFAGVNNFTNTQKDYLEDSDLRPDEGRFVYAGIKLNNLNF